MKIKTILLIEYPHLTGDLIAMEEPTFVDEDHVRRHSRILCTLPLKPHQAKQLEDGDDCDELIRHILSTARHLYDCTHVYALDLKCFMEVGGHPSFSADLRGVILIKTLAGADTDVIEPVKEEPSRRKTVPLLKAISDRQKIPGPAYAGDISRPPLPRRPDDK